MLQADGYTGYAGLYGDGRVVEAACLAHARRKFFDVHATTKSPLAREALDRIGALYKIEDDIRGRPAEQRLRVRDDRTAALMAALRDWLEATRGRVSGRGELAAAIRYTLSRWQALTLILRDGRACVDNSAAERAMHPIALGRRDRTFAGSDAGGDLQPGRDGQAERARPGGVSAPRHRAHRRPSGPARRRAAPCLDQRITAQPGRNKPQDGTKRMTLGFSGSECRETLIRELRDWEFYQVQVDKSHIMFWFGNAWCLMNVAWQFAYVSADHLTSYTYDVQAEGGRKASEIDRILRVRIAEIDFPDEWQMQLVFENGDKLIVFDQPDMRSCWFCRYNGAPSDSRSAPVIWSVDDEEPEDVAPATPTIASPLDPDRDT